jgi:hypothetical protein
MPAKPHSTHLQHHHMHERAEWSSQWLHAGGLARIALRSAPLPCLSTTVRYVTE